MKGPGIKDYLTVLTIMKEDAQNEGKEYLEINSKQLHAEVSPEHATMPTCCQAIYKLMLEGDEIIQRPKGTTGFGSHLTVRYYMKDLENRKRMFPDKKRGRPAKTEEEKLAARRAKMKRNTEDLANLIKQWLQDHGWRYEEKKDVIEAYQQQEK